jgi:oxalate decarboxylase
MFPMHRRAFLSGAAATSVALLTNESVNADPPDGALEPIRGDEGAVVLGPTNPERAAQSPDAVVPPVTDHGTTPNIKWSFSDSHNRLKKGGWARQTTIRELPVAKDLALVNMRLTSGGVREMHWHTAAEWAIMLKGRARVCAIDQEGRTFQDEIEEGDLWNFPSGVPHAIQGLGDEGCEFLLVFDDGNFNENSTFSLTDWLAHTPRSVLAKNFGVSERAFAGIPEEELYIFPSALPGPFSSDRVAGAGPVPTPFTHRLLKQKPIRSAGGTVRISDSSTFPAASTVSAAFVEIEPGGMRELHWHPNADEMQYYISGRGRMTLFAAHADAGTFDYQAGDVGYAPRNMAHYIENTGTTTLRYLELWKTDRFADVSLRQWLAFTPFELVRAHLNIDRSVLANIPTQKTPVVPV